MTITIREDSGGYEWRVSTATLTAGGAWYATCGEAMADALGVAGRMRA